MARGQHYLDSNEWLSRQLRTQLELKVNHRQWRGFVSAYLSQDSAAADFRDPWLGELLEAYLYYDAGDINITLGRQRVAWGTADGLSTIDRLNAIDLRNPIGNARTPSRRPSWLFRVEQQVGPGTLEAVWLPRGKDRKRAEFGSPWESSGLHFLRSEERLGNIDLRFTDPNSGELGLRYLHYGQGFDWSVAFFNGYGDGPEQISERGRRVTLRPVRSRTFNTSAAFGLSQSTVRAELAYTPDAMISDERTPLWQLIAGWDRTFLTSLYTNVQAFWFNAADFEQYGLTFSVSNNFADDALSSGVRGQLINQDQLSIEVFTEYQWDDHLRLGGKLLFFDGDRGTTLGDFRENDLVEISISWSF
ncbi:MAG: DUF1302 family protein [Pseudomonadota bacterium]